MKKNKIGFISLAFGALAFLACVPFAVSGDKNANPYFDRDTTFLVVLKGDIRSNGINKVKEIQNDYLASLRSKVGFNFTVEQTLNAINVLKIKANSSLESVLKDDENVLKVAINQHYRFGDTFSMDQLTEEEKAEGYVPYRDYSVTLAQSEGDDEDPLSNRSAKVMNVPEVNNGGAGSFVAILDTGYYLPHEVYSNLTGEGAAKARFHYSDLLALQSNESLVAKANRTLTNVTDSFVNDKIGNDDGSTYYNLKVPFYYDYAGNYDSSSNSYDAYSYASEHGNHVASTTAANGPYKGIAPNAQLALMKVFQESFPTEANPNRSTYTGAGDDDIAEALNDALLLGVDAINMSLGSDLDDFEGRSAGFEALRKLSDAGCNCNISAGNGGKGLYSFMNGYQDWSTSQVDTGVLGSYATTNFSNIIGSSTTDKQHYDKAIEMYAKDENGNIIDKQVVGYSDQVDKERNSLDEERERLLEKADVTLNSDGEIEFVTAGVADENGNYYGQESDYAKVLAEFPNYYKGKIAVCDRGNTTFVAKAQAAEEAGAAGLIVINNDPTAYEFTFGMSWGSGDDIQIPNIPVVFVLYRDRNFILNKASKPLLSAENTQVGSQGSFKLLKDEDADNPDKNKMSDFSSEGASSLLEIIPTISTPGSSIKGAVQGKANNKGVFDKPQTDTYAYLSGTSMSCPNFTGIVALLIGEQEFGSDAERVAYLKSIRMRTMSTATQYETKTVVYHEIDEFTKYKESDKDHKDPITVYRPREVGDAEGAELEEREQILEDAAEVAPYSPRKEGAGIVNAGKAINSGVYLEGLKVNQDGSFSSEGNGFGKIELKNNDLIKNGNIKLGFRAHNEKALTKTYDVKMNVMSSLVNAYHNHDNQSANYVGRDAKFEGAKVQSANDIILEKDVSLGSITLNGNATQDFTLNVHGISQESKDYLAQFENGAYLEGYVYLTPRGEQVSDSNPSLNLPFMGFYGDYDTSEAVEPFQFEKEEEYDRLEGKTEGHVYGSDLVNFVGKNSYGLTNIGTGSMIAAASFNDYEANDRKTTVTKNSENILGFGTPLVIDHNEETGEYTLHVGGEDTDVLYIQQFVNRSISSGEIRIEEVGNPTNGVTAYLKDILRNGKNLFKSHITANYISGKQLVHRAYAEVPLYNNGVKLRNGTYNLTFTYNLLYGSVQKKAYKLVIDGSEPKVAYRGIYSDGNKEYIRIIVNELYLPSEEWVRVNADRTSFTLTKSNNGYIIDIPRDSAFIDGKLFILLQDGTYNSTSLLLNEEDAMSGLMLINNTLTPGSTYSYKSTDLGGNMNLNTKYELSVKDYRGQEVEIGKYEALISFTHGFTANTLKVFGVNEAGELVSEDIVYEVISNSQIKVISSYKAFVVQDSGKKYDDFIVYENAYVTFHRNAQLHGEVFCDKLNGKAGDKVSVYVIAKEGYEVKEVKVNGQVINVNEFGTYTFTLNDGENVVSVSYQVAQAE